LQFVRKASVPDQEDAILDLWLSDGRKITESPIDLDFVWFMSLENYTSRWQILSAPIVLSPGASLVGTFRPKFTDLAATYVLGFIGYETSKTVDDRRIPFIQEIKAYVANVPPETTYGPFQVRSSVGERITISEIFHAYRNRSHTDEYRTTLKRISDGAVLANKQPLFLMSSNTNQLLPLTPPISFEGGDGIEIILSSPNPGSDAYPDPRGFTLLGYRDLL